MRNLERRIDRVEEDLGRGDVPDAIIEQGRAIAEQVMRMPEAWPAIKDWGDWLMKMGGGKMLPVREMLSRVDEWRQQDPMGWEYAGRLRPFLDRVTDGGAS